MTNKLKVFAMLLCVALFGTLTSCTKEPGTVDVINATDGTPKEMIGKWNVDISPVGGNGLYWKGTLEFKKTGELLANGVWNFPGYNKYSSVSWSGEGSYQIYKKHIVLSVPKNVSSDGYILGALFEFSGTIQSITDDKMEIYANADAVTPANKRNMSHIIKCMKIEE